MNWTYPVLAQARAITDRADLDILEGSVCGVQLASSIREWLHAQPSHRLLALDFQETRAITASLALELGPVLMQVVSRLSALEHRYPIYRLNEREHAATFALAFESMNWTCLALVKGPIERSPAILPMATLGSEAVVVLGTLSSQMEQILLFTEQRLLKTLQTTADSLTSLDFLRKVSASARGQRLSELYARRLLSFVPHPDKARTRLFTPAWRLESASGASGPAGSAP
jgi:hypothetical protein